MKESRPVYRVTLDEFYVDVTEVTNVQYQVYVTNGASSAVVLEQ